MANNTKERILEAALETFSREGYVGANLKDIAESVGVVKSAFYRHYTSKEEVWNAVIDTMEAYYEERFGSADHLPAIPQNTNELKELTLRMLHFTIFDEKIVLTRKLLLTEQFRDERVRRLATTHFSDGLEALFAKIFAGMMENGSLKKEDASMLAFTYTAPISTLVQLCDREPERREEVLQKINDFIDYFIRIFGSI